jgi:hypothetical protein
MFKNDWNAEVLCVSASRRCGGHIVGLMSRILLRLESRELAAGD